MATIDTSVGLDVRPLTTFTGAEIHGVDLSQPLDVATVAAIRATLLRWKVVFFRDQDITSEQQIAFGRSFGDVTPAHPTLAGLEGTPEVLSLDSRKFKAAAAASAEAGGDKRAGAAVVGEYIDNRWHTDVTFVVNPPMASILRGVIVPPYGGDTSWTNLVVAYEHLSEPIKRAIDGLQAVHANVLYSRSPSSVPGATKREFESIPYTSIHPVVRVHPETGEKALFVNPGFTRNLVGVTTRESEALLNILFAQLAQNAFTVRFRWEPGSIAFWDNRATCHRAPGDLSHLQFDRVVQRITLEGDIPTGPDGFTSLSIEGDQFTAA